MFCDYDLKAYSHLEAVTEKQYSRGKWQQKEFSVLLASFQDAFWTKVDRDIIFVWLRKKDQVF